jgi:hypothetical protein
LTHIIHVSPFKKGNLANPLGRPQKPEDEKRVRLTATVAPETNAWLRGRAKAQEVSQGVVIDRLVKAKRDSA